MAEQSFIEPARFWEELGLRAGQSVAHLGSGPGFYLIPAAKIVGKSGRVIGIDVQQQLLEETASRAEREGLAEVVKTIRADLEAPNGSTLPTDSVDWVLIANILHQADGTALFREATRIVKPTGAVIVVDWKPSDSPFGPPAEDRVSQNQAETVAQAAGLTKSHDFQPSPYHFGLILKQTT